MVQDSHCGACKIHAGGMFPAYCTYRSSTNLAGGGQGRGIASDGVRTEFGLLVASNVQRRAQRACLCAKLLCSRDAARRVRHTSRNTPYHAAGCAVIAAGLHQQAMVAGKPIITTIVSNHMSGQHTAAQASASMYSCHLWPQHVQHRRYISGPYAKC